MRVLIFTLLALPVYGFSPIPVFRRCTTSLDASVSRGDFLQAAALICTSTIFAPSAALAGDVITLPSGVSYTVVKNGAGPSPTIGELAAIRFNAFNGDTKIDDIFDTPEPLYTRVGSGGMLKVGAVRSWLKSTYFMSHSCRFVHSLLMICFDFCLVARVLRKSFHL